MWEKPLAAQLQLPKALPSQIRVCMTCWRALYGYDYHAPCNRAMHQFESGMVLSWPTILPFRKPSRSG